MEEKKGWLETRRYVCRKCGSSMIIESSGIRHWECTKCHTVNYEENYLENKLKQELDKAREEGMFDRFELSYIKTLHSEARAYRKYMGVTLTEEGEKRDKDFISKLSKLTTK